MTEPAPLDLGAAADLAGDAVLARLHSGPEGLTGAEAARRRAAHGPNELRGHGVGALGVLARQLRNPLLALLAAAAVASVVVGDPTTAGIVLGIVALSVGLGFVNEYRSARAVQALHARIRHRAVVRREGREQDVDVTDLVPGDVVRVAVGDVVPADLRLVEATGLQCDEAVLTGESLPAGKRADATGPAACLLMGTIVRAGAGLAVVVGTGRDTEFGRIAASLARRVPDTTFQVGLRAFSALLVRVTAVLTVSIFVINAALDRPLLDAALFALAIAVGLTPQLLPAIVTVSLSAGSRRLAARSVLVKRLVSIEDLGNLEVLFTDKTGTLTEGRIRFAAALGADGRPSAEVLRLGVLCSDAVVQDGAVVAGNPLDRALREAHPGTPAGDVVARAPFDYERQRMSVLVGEPGGRRLLVVKGAPERVLERCAEGAEAGRALAEREFAQGAHLVAVAVGEEPAGLGDEGALRFAGLLAFSDPPKPGLAESLRRLRTLGVDVKVVTGDNPVVARRLCADVGLEVGGVLAGADVAALDDDALAAALPATTVFARMLPEQKSRVIRAQERLGTAVGFLGDGVNDAVALHDADVGISVDTASDVARDAADVVLLRKDLGVLADGIVEGRRIFANTVKYVLMATSSNFGNMFSAAGASLFLSYLPMLPSQILLNNLLYDAGEMTIPTDRVDGEQLERPARWDIRTIRRFMMFFGPISSIFDFATFGIVLGVFGAHAELFRSAWFVESLCTQSLVIFAIRTRRVPFWRSRPSRPLAAATVAAAAVGAALPFSPLAGPLGFTTLPADLALALAGLAVVYLALVELGKAWFYRTVRRGAPIAVPRSRRHRHVHRRATRWSRPHGSVVPRTRRRR